MAGVCHMFLVGAFRDQGGATSLLGEDYGREELMYHHMVCLA